MRLSQTRFPAFHTDNLKGTMEPPEALKIICFRLKTGNLQRRA